MCLSVNICLEQDQRSLFGCCVIVQQLGEGMKSREKDVEELKGATSQLGDKSVNHPIHKEVKDVTEQYENINNSVESRANMLSQFKPRVSEHEQLVEQFTQWLDDCSERVDELPVADMSPNGLHSQLTVVEVMCPCLYY